MLSFSAISESPISDTWPLLPSSPHLGGGGGGGGPGSCPVCNPCTPETAIGLTISGVSNGGECNCATFNVGVAATNSPGSCSWTFSGSAFLFTCGFGTAYSFPWTAVLTLAESGNSWIWTLSFNSGETVYSATVPCSSLPVTLSIVGAGGLGGCSWPSTLTITGPMPNCGLGKLPQFRFAMPTCKTCCPVSTSCAACLSGSYPSTITAVVGAMATSSLINCPSGSACHNMCEGGNGTYVCDVTHGTGDTCIWTGGQLICTISTTDACSFYPYPIYYSIGLVISIYYDASTGQCVLSCYLVVGNNTSDAGAAIEEVFFQLAQDDPFESGTQYTLPFLRFYGAKYCGTPTLKITL